MLCERRACPNDCIGCSVPTGVDARVKVVGVVSWRAPQPLMNGLRSAQADVSCGSWPCEKADVLRRRRIAFSSVARPFLLARGRLATPIDAGAQTTSKVRRFLCFQCAGHSLPLMLLCVEPWMILEA